ncbi:MAG: hypothetical protein FJZ00_05695, partial [Candidatus Sericytochromatia bacterium]|nr:hypothetical protein [Candidatus Tanganyikabacteria bacterium]
MTSTRRFTLFAVLAATLAGCGVSAGMGPMGAAWTGDGFAAQNAVAPWAMYTFFAMDNDLDRGNGAIREIAETRTPSVVTASLWDGVQQGDSQLFFQSGPGLEMQAGNKGEVDSGTAAALEKFVAEATTVSPAKQRVLTMTDHGGGIVRGICSDWNGPGGKKIIHLNEVSKVLAKFPVDVLNFDACFMNMIEVAYEVRGGAKFLTGAQTTTYANEFSYGAAVGAIEKNKASAQAVAASMTEVGHRTSSKTHSYSTVDTAKSEAVATAVKDLAGAMNAKMGTKKDAMRQAVAGSQAYSAEAEARYQLYNNYRDLGDIADSLAKLGDPELTQAAKGVRTAISQAVIAKQYEAMWQSP